MPTVIIPREAKAVPCPNCGRVLRNLAMREVTRRVGCLCGASVTIKRRSVQPNPTFAKADRRKRVGAAQR